MPSYLVKIPLDVYEAESETLVDEYQRYMCLQIQAPDPDEAAVRISRFLCGLSQARCVDAPDIKPEDLQ